MKRAATTQRKFGAKHARIVSNPARMVAFNPDAEYWLFTLYVVNVKLAKALPLLVDTSSLSSTELDALNLHIDVHGAQDLYDMTEGKQTLLRGEWCLAPVKTHTNFNIKQMRIFVCTK